MHELRRARLVAYGVAVLATGLSLLLRLALFGFLDDRAPFVTFFPAIILSAYLGGVRPGLLATLLSAAAAVYFLLEPRHSFFIQDASELYALALFVLIGVALSVWGESRHRAQRRLAASECRYAVTLASIGDAVIATDTRARVSFLNPAAEALTGWPPREAVGRPLAEVFRIVNEQTRRPVEDPAAEVLRLGTTVGLANHTVLLARDGRELPIDDCAAPIFDDRGRVAGVVLVFRDVTRRRRAEEAEAFRRANERMEQALRGSGVFVWDVEFPDGDGARRRAVHSMNLWEPMGYVRPPTAANTEAELQRGHLRSDEIPSIDEVIRACLADETAGYEKEFRLRHLDGSDRNMLARGVAVRDAAGKPIRFVGAAVDITELKRAEVAVRASEARFRALVQNSSDIILLFDSEGNVRYQSPSIERLLGYRPEEWIGRNVFDDPIVHPDDQAAKQAFFETARDHHGAPATAEFRLRHADGSWRDVDAVGQSFLHDPGVAGVVANYRDITERKRLDAELRRAKEAAEAANRAKDEFLANVSHEIRTPMNAILGMTELALDTPLSEDQRHYLKTVKSAADGLLGIINDLLDFSKIEAGKLELDPADFSLRDTVGGVLRTLAMRAHRKGLELVSHVHPDVPDALVGDAGRLRQVLLNLVGNAIKFTEAGEVLVRVEDSGEPAADAGVCLRFEVRDTGIGIPRERQASVFRAFEQEDSSTTRRYGGTGLGLTIAARLVALMDGAISVESEPGRGSTFTFTARFGRQPSPPGPGTVQSPLPVDNLRVLIVDDSATNRRILEEWLRGWGMQPTARGDAPGALDALGEGTASGRPYALVLLDSRMPDADGLSLAASIREQPELSATRIILLTSGDLSHDRARLRELRIDAHLLKPVQQDELLETIYRVMNRGEPNSGTSRRPTQVPAAIPARLRTAAPLRVLVAEDDEFSAQLIMEILTRRGDVPRLAKDGLEALELARGHAFDLLLLDVHMPGLDGFQVVREIREREEASGGHLPVIALTARSRSEDRERCLAVGMDDFLSKPIRLAELWAAIDRVVSVGPSPDRPGAELLDARVLLATCGSDADTLERISQTFRTRLPGQLAAVRDALQDGDAPRLSEAAHRLCGMMSAISTVAADVASDVEDLAATGRIEDCRPLLARLQAMADDLMYEASRLSIEALQLRIQAADDPDPT